MAAINLSQVSEFSIVLAGLAVMNGMAGKQFGTIITLVAIITIACASYLTQHDRGLFRLFERWRPSLFDRIGQQTEQRQKPGYQLLLFGYSRGGQRIYQIV